MNRLLIGLLLLATTTAVDADAPSRAQLTAADDRVTPVLIGKGKVPAPTKQAPVAVVFGGDAVPPDAACKALRTASLASESDVARLTACVQTAMRALKLDDPKLQQDSIDEASVTGLRSRFAKNLQANLVVPKGSKLIGKLFARVIDEDNGIGVATFVYALIDGDNHVTAAYVYAGPWSWPV